VIREQIPEESVMSGHDVVVVGTGVVGMSIALAAAEAGLNVGLVGPGYDTDGAASRAAGAMLGVLGEHTATERNLADLRFRHESAARWPRWLDSIAEHTGTRVPTGDATVILANLDHTADRDNLRAIRAAAKTLEVPVEDLEPQDIPGLRPAPRHAPVAALLCPSEGWVDAPALMSALDTACETHWRIRRTRAEARGISLASDGRAAGITLEDGRLVSGDSIVLAAGAATGDLLAPLADRTGPLPAVLAAKGVSLLLEVSEPAQPPVVVRTPNRDFACGLHMVPRGPGGLYVGATNRFADRNRAGATAGEQLNVLHGLLHQFRLDLAGARVTQVRWGHRPVCADGLPMIGRCDVPGLLIATGTYRNGVLMAPAIAEILTADLLGSPAPLEHHYQPRRTDRPDPAGLLRTLGDGAAQMASFLLGANEDLPFDRERHLTTALANLLELAFGDGPDSYRELVRTELAGQPTVEGVGRIFIEYLGNPASRRLAKRTGAVPLPSSMVDGRGVRGVPPARRGGGPAR
jgi:glycine/D-amino acid oxidase-like deaminating enzyme